MENSSNQKIRIALVRHIQPPTTLLEYAYIYFNIKLLAWIVQSFCFPITILSETVVDIEMCLTERSELYCQESEVLNNLSATRRIKAPRLVTSKISMPIFVAAK